MNAADTRAVLHALVDAVMTDPATSEMFEDLSWLLYEGSGRPYARADMAHEIADILAFEITPGIDVEAET